MIRHYLPMVELPAIHHRACEQLQRRYHIMIEEYPGKYINHVLTGVKEMIIRLPQSGYHQPELIVELYRMHLRYIQRMHLPFALIESFHAIPLLHWALDEHLIAQIANELELQQIHRYLCAQHISTDCLQHLCEPVTVPEYDIRAIEKNFRARPSSAILHRSLYLFFALKRNEDIIAKNILFRLSLASPDFFNIPDRFEFQWRQLFRTTTRSNKCLFKLSREFMQALGQWNLSHLLCN